MSVKERYPDREGTYLVATRRGGVTVSHFYAEHCRFSSSRLHNQITYWMPMPRAPKQAITNQEVIM